MSAAIVVDGANGTRSEVAARMRRHVPAFQAAIGEVVLAGRHQARIAGAKRLEAELGRSLDRRLSATDSDHTSAFVAGASLTAAWGQQALQMIAAGKSVAKITERLRPVIERLAATEVAQAFNEERTEVLKGIDVDVLKVWSAVLDVDTCKECSAADGETVGVNDAFRAGEPPLHPNCRCIVEIVSVPDVKDLSAFKRGLKDVIRGDLRKPAAETQAADFGRLSDGTVIRFMPHPNARRYETTVVVDAKALERAWKRDSLYIAPNEEGIGGRRAGVERFLATGAALQASRVSVVRDDSGAFRAVFTDGRHRFSTLREKGIDRVAITISRAELRKLPTEWNAVPLKTKRK